VRGVAAPRRRPGPRRVGPGRFIPPLSGLVARAGFDVERLLPVGSGPFLAAANAIRPFLWPRPFAAAVAVLALCVDRVVSRLRRQVSVEIYPVAYFVVLRKPAGAAALPAAARRARAHPVE